MDPNRHAPRRSAWCSVVTDSASPHSDLSAPAAAPTAQSAGDRVPAPGVSAQTTSPAAAAPLGASAAAGTPYTAYSVSWNLTQRCNLECSHCYMWAFARANTLAQPLSAEWRRVLDAHGLGLTRSFL